MSKDDFDPRFDPAFQPGFTGQAPPREKRQKSPAEAALEAARVQADRVPAVVETADGEQEPVARRVNPFLLALGILAFALMMAGVQGVRTLQSVFDNKNLAPDIDYTTTIMLAYASPLAFALGIAIAAGVLFMYAIAWQRKP